MAYYHGTNALIGFIDLSKSRLRTDFGKGFYFANATDTAQGWATRRTMVSGGIPTILRYEFNNDLFDLSGKRFPAIPSIEWLDFISLNRQRSHPEVNEKEPRHGYHWVSGPIANDDIADVIDEFLAGEITCEAAVHRARALPQTYQLSLHTQVAADMINEEGVLYRQFKKGRWTKDWLNRTNLMEQEDFNGGCWKV